MKRLKIFVVFVLILCLAFISCYSQQDFRGADYKYWYQMSIGKGDGSPTVSDAWLEIGKYGTTKGLILPRGNKFNINYVEGNFLYNTPDKSLYFGDGTTWQKLITGTNLEDYDSAYVRAEWLNGIRTLRLHRLDQEFTDVVITGQTLSLVNNNLSISGGNSVNLFTTNVAEGTNLYFTNARARQAISLSNGLSYNMSTGEGILGGPLTANTSITGGNVYNLSATGLTSFVASTSGVSQSTVAAEYKIYSGINDFFKVNNAGDIIFSQYGGRSDAGNTGNVLFVNPSGVVQSGPVNIATPTLDQVTTAGNTTGNAIQLTGDNNTPTTGTGLVMRYISGPNRVLLNTMKDAETTEIPGLQMFGSMFQINGIKTGEISRIGADILDISGISQLDLGTTGAMTFTYPAGTPAQFQSAPGVPARVGGAPALTANEFITRQQSTDTLNARIAAIPTPTLNQVATAGNVALNKGLSSLASTAGTAARFLAQSTAPSNKIAEVTAGNASSSTTIYTLDENPGLRFVKSVSATLNPRITASNSDLEFLLGGATPTHILYSDGRMSGANAVNPLDFVTLQQLPTIINIYNSDGTLTSNRLVDGNQNSLEFHNNSLLRLAAGETGTASVLELSTTGSFSRGTESITLFDNVIQIESQSPTGNIVVNAPTLTFSQLFNSNVLIPNQFLTTNAAGEVSLDAVTFLNGGSISYDPATGTLTNTAPDQTVVLNNGTGISVTGTYPNFTITNTAAGGGTVTSVGLTSSDITVGGTSPITTSGTFTLTLPNINANVGTFNNLTVNAKGQVTGASNVAYLTTEVDPTAIKNQTTVQTASFNVSGTGTIGNGLTVTAGTSTITGDISLNATPSGGIAFNFDGTNAIGDIFYRNSSGKLERLGIGSNGTVLGSNGTTPEWVASGGSGTVTSVGISSSDITVGSSPITTSGTITLTLPNINANIGTFNNLTVNAKGQVTSASNVSYLTSYTETDPVVSARTLTLSNGTGISISGGTQDLTASRSWTITNTAPDQTVTISSGTGISVTGTYPNFTVAATSSGVSITNGTLVLAGGTEQLRGFRFSTDYGPVNYIYSQNVGSTQFVTINYALAIPSTTISGTAIATVPSGFRPNWPVTIALPINAPSSSYITSTDSFSGSQSFEDGQFYATIYPNGDVVVGLGTSLSVFTKDIAGTNHFFIIINVTYVIAPVA